MFALRRLPFFLNWFLLLFGLLWSCLVLGFELYIDDALAFEVDYLVDFKCFYFINTVGTVLIK